MLRKCRRDNCWSILINQTYKATTNTGRFINNMSAERKHDASVGNDVANQLAETLRRGSSLTMQVVLRRDLIEVSLLVRSGSSQRDLKAHNSIFRRSDGRSGR
jgi:hypothetical protein